MRTLCLGHRQQSDAHSATVGLGAGSTCCQPCHASMAGVPEVWQAQQKAALQPFTGCPEGRQPAGPTRGRCRGIKGVDCVLGTAWHGQKAAQAQRSIGCAHVLHSKGPVGPGPLAAACRGRRPQARAHPARCACAQLGALALRKADACCCRWAGQTLQASRCLGPLSGSSPSVAHWGSAVAGHRMGCPCGALAVLGHSLQVELDSPTDRAGCTWKAACTT